MFKLITASFWKWIFKCCCWKSLSPSLISLYNWMILVYLRGYLTFCCCFIILNLPSHIQYEDKQKSAHLWMDIYFWNLWLTTFKNIRLWGFIDRKKASQMCIWCDLSMCKNKNVNSQVHCCRMSDNLYPWVFNRNSYNSWNRTIKFWFHCMR